MSDEKLLVLKGPFWCTPSRTTASRRGYRSLIDNLFPIEPLPKGAFASMVGKYDTPMYERDFELKATALNMWANYIETGDVLLNAHDAENMKRKVKALSDDQKVMILRLRALAEEETAAGNKNIERLKN